MGNCQKWPVIMIFIDSSSEVPFYYTNHPEKQRHYYCSFHENKFVENAWNHFTKSVFDLCDIQKFFQINDQKIWW